MKPLLLVSDVKNWAFDVIANGLKPYIDFDLLYTSDTPRITKADIAKYKETHIFNWLGAQSFAGMPGVSAGVHQHGYTMKWGKQAKKYIPKFEKMVGISKEICEDIKKWNPNTTYIPNGVDPELFTPFDNTEELTIGWCGQKTKGGFGEIKGKEGYKWDIKGFELILKPLFVRLNIGQRNVKFKVNCADYKKCLSREEMAEWYDDIDIFICTSIYEGGPLPVLEAASAGKPIISTRVGIVPELIDHGFSGYLIDAPRNRGQLPDIISEFETYINILIADKDMRQAMGRRNRAEIVKNWTWKHQAEKWKKFFEQD